MTDFPLPFDPYTLAIGGFGLIPTIIFLVQIIKPYVPNATPQVWRVVALVLGILLVFVSQLDNGSLPTTASGIITLLITGLIVGKLAHEGYDQTIRLLTRLATEPRPAAQPLIFQSMDVAFGAPTNAGEIITLWAPNDDGSMRGYDVIAGTATPNGATLTAIGTVIKDSDSDLA